MALAVAVLAVILALAVLGFVASRRVRARAPAAAASWTDAAGHEFAGLAESARCDLVFAVAALEDGRSQDLLERALDDPSEPVALAAAHALVGRGARTRVDRYLAAHPGVRASHLAAVLALLEAES